MKRESILYQFHNPETKATLACPLEDGEMNGLEISKYRKKFFRAFGQMIINYSEKSQCDNNLYEIKILCNDFMIIYYMQTY